MKFTDYYKTIGVKKSTPYANIQKAYRKLAREFHPDVNKSSEAEARFKAINEAYEVLKDSDKRAKYDRYGAAWRQMEQQGGGGLHGFDFGDFAGLNYSKNPKDLPYFWAEGEFKMNYEKLNTKLKKSKLVLGDV